MIVSLNITRNVIDIKFKEFFMRIEKPWGFEEILEENDLYVLKRLFMRQGHRCSLQYHRIKCETIYVVSGVLNITTGENPDSLVGRHYVGGQSVTVRPGLIHRMEAIEDAVYIEASTPHLDDVVRLGDDYCRQ